MVRRFKKSLVASAAILLAAGGYFIYGIYAAQGQGELAQQPLNNTVQAPPAFIMAVDDSNSMMFERIFAGGDGRMRWNGSSFFSSAGVFFDVGTACDNNSVDCYLHLFPHTQYNTNYSYGVAIPPLDVFGFARSPTYNAGYFNPAVTYDPWRQAAAVNNSVLWPNADVDDVRADPRTTSDFSVANGVSYDLTNVNGRAVRTETFRFLPGMVLPANTPYSTSTNSERCFTTNWFGGSNGDGLPGNGNSFGSLNRDYTFVATCNVAVRYFPATFYLPAAAAAPAGYKTADANRPVINNACGPGCNMRRYEIKAANYNSTAEYQGALQNYANWFEYHRNRILSMVGSSSHAMAEVNNMRVGYFTINSLKDVTMYDVNTARASLYNQIYSLKPNGGTPNREAVAFLGQQFRRTDKDAPVQLACQRNGGMLFTDGYTNTSSSTSGFDNADSAGGTHFPGAPFADGYNNTIADVAAGYYAGSNFTPLRTGTAFPVGQVAVPKECDSLDKSTPAWKRLDCQTNLHMNFYGVTLGAQGRIFEVNQQATADPYTNAPDWNSIGNPTSSDDGRVIDEIWHAAINSRGEFINAKTPAEVTAAMRRVLSSVSGGASTSGSFALSGARIGAGSLSVTPRYEVLNNGTDWFSRLQGSRVTVDQTTREAVYSQAWEASTAMPSPSARNVWFASGTALTKLSTTSITLAGICGLPQDLYPGLSRCPDATNLPTGTTVANAASYLLGDTTTEVRLGGRFRDRTTVIGDIINSTPVISAPGDDYGYRSLGGVYATSYLDYLTSKRNSRRYTVYVGANDGMLHAYDGGMDAQGNLGGNGGRELFGYIPGTSYGHLGNLLMPYDPANKNNQKFAHRYFVDGPVAVGDTYNNNTWSTTLVGTTGAGGRSVFALDVSDPTAFDDGKRLWEISDLTATDSVKANIGHVLGKPVIVPVRAADGSVAWKAIFGNGYASKSGKAVLFVVDLKKNPTIRMIEATESGSAVAGSNGLGNIMVVDRVDSSQYNASTKKYARVRDGFADTVYAADQKGAIWKFDLLDTATTLTRPFFTTGTFVDSGSTYRQPIMGGLQATAGENGSVLLLFGTGSYSFVNDGTDNNTQSLYGVNDYADGAVTSTVLPSQLMPYAVSTSRTLVPGTRPTGALGWRVDLPSGERMVGYPEIASGILFMPTYKPLNSSGCSTDGNNSLFGLNPRTGTAALFNVRVGSIANGAKVGDGVASISLSTGGNAPVKDVGVAVVPRLQPPVNPLDGTPAPTLPELTGCWMAVTVAGAAPMYVPYPCGRQSWRQIQ
ncbi:pilus assembly protein [Isoptericola jiangsuensis]|uniref:pilus assembly protein n=1 Tax=Isoptericola jiangsuensis TaxID=548579 RepID=UPI00386F4BF5